MKKTAGVTTSMKMQPKLTLVDGPVSPPAVHQEQQASLGILRDRVMARSFPNRGAYLVVLYLIAESSRSCFEIAQAIEEMSVGRLQLGAATLYPDLLMLAGQGYITERPAERGLKRYTITEEGSTHLSANRATANVLLQRLRQTCEGEYDPRAARLSVPRHITRLIDSLKLAFRVRLEGKQVHGNGNALRAGVLGANDGLVSNLSLVMGMIGASVDPHMVLIAATAGLIAGASSMALGEWLSVKNAREHYQYQIAKGNSKQEGSPESERAEFASVYQARGFSESDAAVFAELMQANVSELDTMVRDALSLDDAEKLSGSPYVAAISSFCLFAMGAAMPLLPYCYSRSAYLPFLSLGAGLIVLTVIGAVTSLFTGRSLLFSAVRQVAIGGLAAAITFGMGHLAEAALS